MTDTAKAGGVNAVSATKKDKQDGLTGRIILSMAGDVGEMVRTAERIRLQFLALAKDNNVKVVLD